MNSSSTAPYSLTSKQLATLNLLYRFRFGTTELLAQSLNVKTRNSMNRRLQLLLQQEYIGRHYSPTYRLQGKHASYFLRAKGIAALRKLNEKYNETVLHNAHKDKSASEQFINHQLAIFKAYCDLRKAYGETLVFLTKSQLRKYDYFPVSLPDAYIRLETATQPHKQYFLEMLQSERPFFVSVQKTKRYQTYWESGLWEDTGTSFPTILLACDSNTLKKRLDKFVDRFSQETDNSDLRFVSSLAADLLKLFETLVNDKRSSMTNIQTSPKAR